MREIKFRAWDGFQFRYGDLRHTGRETVYDAYGKEINPCEAYIYDWTEKVDTEIYGVPYKVDIETIGEYTGAKDANGVEIYEGDIVACYSLTHPNEKYIGKIVFMSEEFKIIWYDGEILRLNKIRFWANSRNIEVIGNIFENKELLEEE